jgi:hypothetical protein
MPPTAADQIHRREFSEFRAIAADGHKRLMGPPKLEETRSGPRSWSVTKLPYPADFAEQFTDC